jgi:hypothetical protein
VFCDGRDPAATGVGGIRIAQRIRGDASLTSFVEPTDEYVAALKARRASALNRLESKTDRTSSADDRTQLTDG